MTFWATKIILLVAISVKMLKLIFNKQTGLYCLICFTSLPLGSKLLFQNLIYGEEEHLYGDPQKEPSNPLYDAPKN